MTTRPMRQTLFVTAVAIVMIPATVFLFGAVTAQRDIQPDGPTCYFETSDGSGPAGIGTEHVRWGIFPLKYCVTSLSQTETWGVVEDDKPFAGLLSALLYPTAIVIGLLTFMAGKRIIRNQAGLGSAAKQEPPRA